MPEKVYLCVGSGCILLYPEDGSPPVEWKDACRARRYQELADKKAVPSLAAPSLPEEDLAALAAASCSRLF